MLLYPDQLQLESTPMAGVIIIQEFTMGAANRKEYTIMGSYLLEWRPITGSLRISGQLSGEKKDSWGWPEEIHAIFVVMEC